MNARRLPYVIIHVGETGNIEKWSKSKFGFLAADALDINGLLKEADEGSRESQFLVGTYYDSYFRNGTDATVDNARAEKYYLLAAQQKHKIAQHNLGVMYESKCEVEEDQEMKKTTTEKAKLWYKKASDQGHIPSIYNLALFHSICKEYTAAVDLFNRVIKHGAGCEEYVRSIYCLADLHQNGLGVEQNLEKSEQLYLEAAELGYPNAQYKLAILLAQKGQKAESEEWLKKAADQHYKEAQTELAERKMWMMPNNGIGLKVGTAHSKMAICDVTPMPKGKEVADACIDAEDQQAFN
ncbi:hypothetical protein HDU98_001373 [Podochytrium sp. JEL0797]|nr:hypothetical protein HDU98_001370 [Podochytrium sp. JEL0797]KAJ3073510.1 hypothetical protein HDU98_001373 [Podochytrium sp. JEL0797]